MATTYTDAYTRLKNYLAQYAQPMLDLMPILEQAKDAEVFLATYPQQAKDAQAQIASLNKQIQVLQARRDDENAAFQNDARVRVASLDAEIASKWESHNARCAARETAANAEVAKAQASLSALQAQIEQAKQDLSKVQADLATKNDLYLKVSKQLDDMVANVHTLTGK